MNNCDKNKKTMKLKFFRPVLLLAFILSVILTGNIKAQDLNSAILLTKSEQYERARTMFQQLIQKEPSNARNFFFLGENYLLGYFADTISNSLTVAASEAKEIYQKGVSANPNEPLNYVGLAKIAYYLGDDRTADEMRTKALSFLLPYKKIKKIVPPARYYAFTLAKVAESYIKDGKVDTAKALPLIRHALKIDSKNAEIYLIAGDIYMLVNDGSSAIRNYNLAQFADPKSPTANMKIGYVYARSGALQSALEYFEEAIGLDDSYAPAYRELGQLYWRAGRLEQSKTNYRKYLDLTAGNIPAKILYVNSLFYANDYDEVIKNVEEILLVDQSRTYMNRIAGYSSFDKKNPDYDKALEYMDKLFASVAPDRIIKKDYQYMARILLARNQGYSKLVDERNTLNTQLDREKLRLNAATTAADRTRFKTSVDNLSGRIAKLDGDIGKADLEIDRAFKAYDKLLEYNPEDRVILNEIAANYYSFRRFEGAAKTWGKMISLGKDDIEDYMRVGRAYYNGAKYKSADSVFNIVVKRAPDYIDAYVFIARTYSRMDPELKLGLARPKFETLIERAKVDSVRNAVQMIEAFRYLGSYHTMNNNLSRARDYYNRMINLDPNNKDNKVMGYLGIGTIETELARNEQTLEGKVAILNRAIEAYNRTLEIDPANASVKAMLKSIQDYQVSIKKGINPNEIKGVIRNSAGQPIPYASVRVKDTAAENLANAKGEYKFEIPQGSEFLIISADGYALKEIPVTATRTYNVTLESQ